MSRSFKSIIVATCAVGLTLAGNGPASAAAARPPHFVRAPDGTGDLSLFAEPGQIGPIYSVLTSARHSLDMTMYELADTAAEADLVADAAHGTRRAGGLGPQPGAVRQHARLRLPERPRRESALGADLLRSHARKGRCCRCRVPRPNRLDNDAQPDLALLHNDAGLRCGGPQPGGRCRHRISVQCRL